jgi:hypothetical protein
MRFLTINRDFTQNPPAGVLSAMAFHEKAGRSQVDSFLACWSRYFSRRVATVATLPSALY